MSIWHKAYATHILLCPWFAVTLAANILSCRWLTAIKLHATTNLQIDGRTTYRSCTDLERNLFPSRIAQLSLTTIFDKIVNDTWPKTRKSLPSQRWPSSKSSFVSLRLALFDSLINTFNHKFHKYNNVTVDWAISGSSNSYSEAFNATDKQTRNLQHFFLRDLIQGRVWWWKQTGWVTSAENDSGSWGTAVFLICLSVLFTVWKAFYDFFPPFHISVN